MRKSRRKDRGLVVDAGADDTAPVLVAPAPEATPQEPPKPRDADLPPADICLNLGAGDSVLPGFTPVDRSLGEEVYPLTKYKDGSVREVYASHILEHFPHRDVEKVIAEWVRVLKPGGRIRIAVPNIRWIAEQIVANAQIPAVGYIYGGQIDDNDFHKTGFDESGMRWLMEKNGLVGVQRWKSDQPDCAALPVSLNLEGYKPVLPTSLGDRCIVVSTMPGLNWTDNRHACTIACITLGIPYLSTSGAYFDQGMERALEQGIAAGKDIIITIDYDTIFEAQDIQRMVVLMDRYPQAGAIAAMQAKRGPDGIPLITRNEHDAVSEEECGGDIFKVKSAHFGLTCIRADVLKKMKKPWLKHKEAPDGSWGDGRVDADIVFWHQLNEVSQVYVSPRVNVGHMQRMVTWIDGGWNPVHQHLEEYKKYGKPQGVRG